FPYFLVTMMSLPGQCCGYGGTGITHAFATHVTMEAIGVQFKHLFAHELFHSWNGERIKLQQPERLYYWFSEGFTDYYAGLLELRAGLVDLDEHVKKVNEMLMTYATSPALRVTNQEVLDRFWKDRAVSKIPYQRGALLAANWNRRIKSASKDAKSL